MTIDCTALMKQQGYELSPKCCAITSVAGIVGVALFIIGCMGAAGTFPGSSIGWVTVGLAGGALALNLALGQFKQRRFDFIPLGLMAAVLVTIGALGGTGILSTAQVGWAIIGTSIALAPVNCIIVCIKAKKMEQGTL